MRISDWSSDVCSSDLQFFADLGPKKSARIELAVMDMWRPFRNSVQKNAPNAGVVFDKFHIMRHLSDALDHVRRDEYKRLQGKDRSRSEEHTSELQSLMRISYAVFCLKKKKHI